MMQTLEDILDETNTALDRMVVWIRIMVETPLTALRENANNLGENGMSKLANVSNKRLTMAAFVIVVLLLGTTVGLEKDTIMSQAANLLYGNSIRKLTIAQDSEISDPVALLGGEASNLTRQCTVGPTRFQPEIDCAVSTQAYFKLGQSSTDRTEVLNATSIIAKALKADGYQSGSNNVTLTSLVAGTYQGRDYSPDAFYQKVIGKDTCMFNTQIAYANPAQPAIHMDLSCGRSLYMFGKSFQGNSYY